MLIRKVQMLARSYGRTYPLTTNANTELQ